jgi:hypothetical protein
MDLFTTRYPTGSLKRFPELLQRQFRRGMASDIVV